MLSKAIAYWNAKINYSLWDFNFLKQGNCQCFVSCILSILDISKSWENTGFIADYLAELALRTSPQIIFDKQQFENHNDFDLYLKKLQNEGNLKNNTPEELLLRGIDKAFTLREDDIPPPMKCIFRKTEHLRFENAMG